ncbi:MAG TPA: hypothetical protein VG246_12465 [Acidimicrobiales bacterium]|nr:hypothetical protein [Acidimicrobiales bacterium]
MSEALLPPSWDGSVVLDIGGDVGALILRTSPSAFAREIDLVPDDGGVPHVHSAVRERRTTDGSAFAAVYPQLKEGSYTIDGTTQRLLIAGGRVTDIVLNERHDLYEVLLTKGEHHVSQ